MPIALSCPAARGSAGGSSTKGSNPSPPPATLPPGDLPRSYTEVRRQAFRLRSGQRGLTYDLHKSLALCGLGRVALPGDPDEASWASLVCDGTRADLRGLTRCASPWACPVCAPRVAAGRARVLAPQIASRLEAGHSSWLVTLTLRHGRQHDLRDLFGALGKAWSRATSGKRWAAVRAVGAVEFIKGFDLTWSARHGWHPHVHAVLLIPSAHGDGEVVARDFAVRWRETLASLGWDALPGAQDVQPCRDAAKAAAYATAPAAVYESIGIATKTGNSNAGLSAFDLLRAAVPETGVPDPAAVARWCEYVTAVKGRRQTTVSRGLSLSEDADLVEDEAALDLDTLATLGEETIAELDRKRMTAGLLEAVESAGGDPSAGRILAMCKLSELRARDWYVAPLPSPPVQPVPKGSVAYVWEPPPRWVSPLTDDGRLWRRITPADKEILLQLARSMVQDPRLYLTPS